MAELTVIILTRDEARHIARCLASLSGLPARVVVVDSGSTDDTVALARAAGAEVLTNPWVNYARQFNWALAHAGITTPWTMRLDADEVVTPALARSIADFLAAPGPAAGAVVERGVEFLGRRLKHGGLFPVRLLRIWRTGAGTCEDRWMDEHILLDGPTVTLSGALIDANLNGIHRWTEKHNLYATREAVDTLLRAEAPPPPGEAGTKRRLKSLYQRLPPGVGPLLYFLYRYVVRLGVLDGWPGLVFHVLQGFWYRFLVDVKIAEIRRAMAATGEPLATVVARDFGMKMD